MLVDGYEAGVLEGGEAVVQVGAYLLFCGCFVGELAFGAEGRKPTLPASPWNEGVRSRAFSLR